MKKTRKKRAKFVEIICTFCNKTFLRQDCYQNRELRRGTKAFYCSTLCKCTDVGRKNKKLSEEDRFWSKVDKTPGLGPKGDCWLWTGGLTWDKYGRFAFSHTKQKLAHIFSYELHYNEIPPGLLVCHKCDNPPCVNPNHLFLGTNQDNQLDSLNKERGQAKLKAYQVKAIRILYSIGIYKQVELAKIFNISGRTISGIVNMETWKYV